ncbi:hypothetical protein BC832DRAFT_374427 [Gaertneriomyces semiglobifer]|nr:hypothetical protein BC832DRAFT_374427 [Gaertneriomyces semiglobifer]
MDTPKKMRDDSFPAFGSGFSSPQYGSDAATQGRLMNMGMRIRKSIYDGYKTGKPQTQMQMQPQPPQQTTDMSPPSQPRFAAAQGKKRKITDFFDSAY